MRSLVIDTSNRYLVIAMYENDQLLEAISEVGSQRQSENRSSQIRIGHQGVGVYGYIQ